MATLEERFALLENRVTELERARQVQEDRDIALLARVDGFIDDLRRIERVQMRSFDELKVGQKELESRLDRVESRLGGVESRLDGVESNIAVLADVAKDHKRAIESIDSRLSSVESNITVLADAAKDHKQAIESLAAGQQQILTILTGGQRRND